MEAAPRGVLRNMWMFWIKKKVRRREEITAFRPSVAGVTVSPPPPPAADHQLITLSPPHLPLPLL